MFTGIVEELGRVERIDHAEESARLTLRGPLVVSDTTHGASIAVNGVCLTVVEHDADEGWFSVDVMAETLSRTGIGDLGPGSPVNLERAMALNGRFGGHVVQGHVDGTSTVLARRPGDRWEVVTFTLPPALAPYVVEKGSITLDGVSLTVSAVADTTFEVSLIPTTLELTTLGHRAVGDSVNVEVDVLAKYVERLLATHTTHAAPAIPATASHATPTTEVPA
ncbi:riboflavin synthase alpha chain [Knoellia remsis]|uniref:Riboflavin synthase n=1 Tax=Knoellia remsis TaxID=407159 RepID=A0A2T0UU93_9MICO|nr:riboflavin synthase [Knoellia remsis]PRY61495.1 riboflavin synthase alpha chain [Knoellia remsis]